MDAGLRRAWTEVITSADYERHMASIGQAQAAAALTRQIVQSAGLPSGARVVIAGAGTGQMLDHLDAALLRPFRLTCTDLNRSFLSCLEERLVRYGLTAAVFEDDFEQTAIEPAPDLLLACLLLEHIDWRRGVDRMTGLRPGASGIIIQENPPGMTSAVTPGRVLPDSIAKAVEFAHPSLVPYDELLAAFEARGYRCAGRWAEEVADGKRLSAILFTETARPAAGLRSS